jgi:hypothetical protein
MVLHLPLIERDLLDFPITEGAIEEQLIFLEKLQ